MNVENYFESLNGELHSLRDRVRGIIDNSHWGEDGRWRESVLRSMLRRQLPKNVLIGTGFLLCPNGKITTQQDIILYTSDAPLLFQDGETVILESKYVFGLIEVKSKVDKAIFKEALRKLSDTLEIAYHEKLLVGLFCYEKDSISDDAIRESVQKTLSNDHQRKIGLISLGENDFICLWGLNPPPDNAQQEDFAGWKHYCFPKKIAIGYFIHNFIEYCVRKNNQLEQSNSVQRAWWYPTYSKEVHQHQPIPFVQSASLSITNGEPHE